MTLTEFLLARIAEDENEADRAGSFTPWEQSFQRDNYGHLTVQPSRVLAECAAKRVAIESMEVESWHFFRAMAAIYSDHPDYRPEWKP